MPDGLMIAVVGADGAGKTTLARRLPDALGVPARCLYLGTNPDGDRSLPAAPGPVRRRRRSAAPWARTVRSRLWVVRLMLAEWLRAWTIWRLRRRGVTVVCDRHFHADYFAHDVARPRGTPLLRRLHGLLLDRWYPKAQLTVILDAPAPVLLARRPDTTLQARERRRQEYLRARTALPGRVVVVDAGRAPDVVLADVAERARDLVAGRRPGGTPAGVSRADSVPTRSLRPARWRAGRG